MALRENKLADIDLNRADEEEITEDTVNFVGELKG